MSDEIKEEIDSKSLEELVGFKNQIVATLVKLTNWSTDDVEYLFYSGVGSLILFIGLIASKFQ
jgi:hypothetical protein